VIIIVGVEVRPEVSFGNEADCPGEDLVERAKPDLVMRGDRQGLRRPSRASPPELHVAAPLGVDGEPEAPKDPDRSAPDRRRSLGMRRRQLQGHDDAGLGSEPQRGEVLAIEVKRDGFP
jgi:hypothetical protein